MNKKIAVVTGGQKGIGKAITSQLIKGDYFVVIASSSKKETVISKLFEYPIDCDYVSCNIASSTDRENLLSYIKEKYGRIDVLVNNAGVGARVRADLLDVEEEDFTWLLDINLKGTFFLSQMLSKWMIALKKDLRDYQPRIVNISSISAYTASINRGEYCISKAGISMTTMLFADRLAKEGIPVFEVRPGIIRTDMTKSVEAKYQNMVMQGITPIQRLGDPEDVGKAVAGLMSGNFDFCTGQVIDADGGFSIRRL